MSELPQITTIIPTYRRPEKLRRAIHSVLAQTYRNLKVCVYDNCSGDETKKVVTELAEKDSRVKYHVHSKNIGLGPNFQFGLEQVDTPFFSLLSDDDFLLPSFYETAIKALQKEPQAAFFAGRTLLLNQMHQTTGITFASLDREGLYTPEETLTQMLHADFPPWNSILFRSIERFKKFDLEIYHAFDIDYLYQISMNYPVVLTKHPCAVFIGHLDSYCSGEADIPALWKGYDKMTDKIRTQESILLPTRNKILDLLYSHREKQVFLLSIKLTIKGDFQQAKKALELLESNGLSSKKNIFLKITLLLAQKSFIFHKTFSILFRLLRNANHLKKRLKTKKGAFSYPS